MKQVWEATDSMEINTVKWYVKNTHIQHMDFPKIIILTISQEISFFNFQLSYDIKRNKPTIR